MSVQTHCKSIARRRGPKGNHQIFRLDSPFRFKWNHLDNSDGSGEMSELILGMLKKKLEIIGAFRDDLKKTPPSPTTALTETTKPSELEHLMVGLNSIKRTLTSYLNQPQEPPIRIIFACKEDANPSVLHMQILMLAAQFNGQIRMFYLKKEAEKVLAAALRQSRCSIIAIKRDAGPYEDICQLLESRTEGLKAAWLNGEYQKASISGIVKKKK